MTHEWHSTKHTVTTVPKHYNTTRTEFTRKTYNWTTRQMSKHSLFNTVQFAQKQKVFFLDFEKAKFFNWTKHVGLLLLRYVSEIHNKLLHLHSYFPLIVNNKPKHACCSGASFLLVPYSTCLVCLWVNPPLMHWTVYGIAPSVHFGRQIASTNCYFRGLKEKEKKSSCRGVHPQKPMKQTFHLTSILSLLSLPFPSTPLISRAP